MNRFRDFMDLHLEKKKQKQLNKTKKEKYSTNPSKDDACYIFDWDVYIEEKKTDSQKKLQDEIGIILK
jgi:hypothetical protein